MGAFQRYHTLLPTSISHFLPSMDTGFFCVFPTLSNHTAQNILRDHLIQCYLANGGYWGSEKCRSETSLVTLNWPRPGNQDVRFWSVLHRPMLSYIILTRLNYFAKSNQTPAYSVTSPLSTDFSFCIIHKIWASFGWVLHWASLAAWASLQSSTRAVRTKSHPVVELTFSCGHRVRGFLQHLTTFIHSFIHLLMHIFWKPSFFHFSCSF